MSNEDTFAALKNSIRQEVLAEVIESITKMTGAGAAASTTADNKPVAKATAQKPAVKAPAVSLASFVHANGTASPKRRGRPRKNPESVSAN